MGIKGPQVTPVQTTELKKAGSTLFFFFFFFNLLFNVYIQTFQLWQTRQKTKIPSLILRPRPDLYCTLLSYGFWPAISPFSAPSRRSCFLALISAFRQFCLVLDIIKKECYAPALLTPEPFNKSVILMPDQHQTLHSLRLLMILCESQNILITHGSYTCLDVFSTILNASEIPHISASKISLFTPRLSFRSCHLWLIWFFQTTDAPAPPLSSLEPSHQSLRWASPNFASRIALFLSSITSSPGKIEYGAVWIGSVPSAGSILKPIETCRASRWL